MLRRAVVVGLCGLAALPASAAASPRVLMLFVGTRDEPPVRPDKKQVDQRTPGDGLLAALGRRPALAIGVMGATQGAYSREQALLDITQGTRLSPNSYSPHFVRPLRLV